MVKNEVKIVYQRRQTNWKFWVAMAALTDCTGVEYTLWLKSLFFEPLMAKISYCVVARHLTFINPLSNLRNRMGAF